MVQSSIVSLNKSLYLRVGNKEMEINVINPELVEQLDDYLPQTLNLNELNGNEVYADLPFEINVESDDVGAIQAGDVMLFGNQTLVIFYQSHPTTYRYTKIGKIKDVSQLKDVITSRKIELIYK